MNWGNWLKIEFLQEGRASKKSVLGLDDQGVYMQQHGIWNSIVLIFETSKNDTLKSVLCHLIKIKIV